MYVKVANGVVDKYLYSIDQLRKDNPEVSFPANPDNDLLAEYGVYPVVNTPEPTYDIATQRLVWGTPALINGQWTHVWEAIPMSPEEQQSVRQATEYEVRTDRNRLLTETDWTQVLDAPVDRAAWAAYRQALRDVPSQAKFPFDVQWPTQPE